MKLLKFILSLFLITTFAKAQVPEMYIIPDIASPGMNVYMEIIGKVSDKFYFGTDGIYLNDNSSAVHIVLTNPADSDKVTFGPLIVSWEGRMISTQVFVNPGLSSIIPSWDYNVNGGNFTVNFSVATPNGPSKGFNLYLVQPWRLGDITGNANTDITFGAGTLGKRSPRGAMIVDSLVLAAGTQYKVSTADCDGQALGNQGYLPFILLSKGPIKGGAGSSFTVSASGKTAGPGGGGGGGKHVDIIILGTDVSEDGGAGFTGGGPGGRNQTGNNGKKNGGIGSGNVNQPNLGGPSLNAVNGGHSYDNVWESAGGGTGHPFGTSGFGCDNGPGCDPSGGYSGGSGHKDGFRGGGGGFGTAGIKSTASANNNGGFVVGNNVCVPISGGSGGASGNPKGTGVGAFAAGNGGGGGGAIRLSASKINNLTVYSNGADGEGGYNGSHGGAGSGGSVEIYCKQPSSCSIQVSGGNTNGTQNGGDGRVRNDTPNGSVNVFSASFTNYSGFLTDTNRFIQTKFNFKGKAFNDPFEKIVNIKVYIKPISKPWRLVGIANRVNTDWDIDIDLSNEKDKLFYLVAVAEMLNPTTSNYTNRPQYIMSQAAANILSIDVVPDINSITTKKMVSYSCDPKKYLDSVWIYNPGTDSLRITTSNSWKIGNKGFQLETPTQLLVIAPKDSFKLMFSFNLQPNKTGIIRDTFQIFSNLLNTAKNPWTIAFEMQIIDLKLRFKDIKTKQFVDTLHFPPSCVGRIDTVKFDIFNTAFEDITITSAKIGKFVNGKLDSDKDFTPSLSSTIVPVEGSSSTTTIQIIYNPVIKNGANFAVYLYITNKKCPNELDSILVWIFVQKSQMTQSNPLENDFGDTKITDKKVKTLKYKNTGSGSSYLVAIIENMNKFKIKAVRPPLPLLFKSKDTLEIDVEYSPDAEIADLDSFRLVSTPTDSSCDDNLKTIVKGNGTRSAINYPTDIQDFGKTLYCYSSVSKNLVIGNDITSKSQFKIIGDELIGTGKSAFTISNRPAKTIFNPGDVDKYVIMYVPPKNSYGVSDAALAIYTDDPTSKTITIKLTGELEPLKVSSVPVNNLNFGSVPIGTKSLDLDLTLTNNGSFKRSVIKMVGQPEIGFIPTVGNINPLGGTLGFKVNFAPVVEGNYSSTFQVIFGGIDCRDTLFYTVNGVGLKGDVNVTGSLDFGILNNCQTKILSPSIVNVGDAPIQIDKVYLSGADMQHFKILNVVDGTTIQNKGENVSLNYSFDPVPPRQYRVYNAELNIDFTLNGQKQSFKQATKAEVRTGFKAIVRPIDFGTVIIGTNKILPFTIYKDKECFWDLTVKNFPTVVDPNWIINTTGILNQILVDSLSGTMEFVPQTVGTKNYQADFEFDMSANCLDNNFFSFTGNAVPAASIRITLPKMEVDPTATNLKIPVKAVIFDGVDTLTGLTISNLQLRFNQSLFYPKSLTKGKIISYKTNGNDLEIKLEIDSINLNRTESIITNVIGDAMLGNKDITPIVIDSVIYIQKNLVNRVDTVSGELKIIICKEGGDRLLNQTTPINFTSIQMADRIDLSLILPEVGDYTLELIDSKGTQIKLEKFTRGFNDVNTKNMSIESKDIPSGAYYIILRSPNKQVTEPILIIK